MNNKLRLVQVAGEARGRRALAAWQHCAALQLRARDHAGALLSGGHCAAHDRLRHAALRDTGTHTHTYSSQIYTFLYHYQHLPPHATYHAYPTGVKKARAESKPAKLRAPTGIQPI